MLTATTAAPSLILENPTGSIPTIVKLARSDTKCFSNTADPLSETVHDD